MIIKCFQTSFIYAQFVTSNIQMKSCFITTKGNTSVLNIYFHECAEENKKAGVLCNFTCAVLQSCATLISFSSLLIITTCFFFIIPGSIRFLVAIFIFGWIANPPIIILRLIHCIVVFIILRNVICNLH